MLSSISVVDRLVRSLNGNIDVSSLIGTNDLRISRLDYIDAAHLSRQLQIATKYFHTYLPQCGCQTCRIIQSLQLILQCSNLTMRLSNLRITQSLPNLVLRQVLSLPFSVPNPFHFKIKLVSSQFFEQMFGIDLFDFNRNTSLDHVWYRLSFFIQSD